MSIEESVRKSGLGYIDLYLLHSPYGGKEVRWECWKAVEDAIEERQVKSGGVSNFGIKHVGTTTFKILGAIGNRLTSDRPAQRISLSPRPAHPPFGKPNRSTPLQHAP